MPATIRKRSREARVIEAIEAYDVARDKFIDLAVDAAEFEGDIAYEASFELAERAMNAAEAPLRNLLQGCKPVVFCEKVYALGHDGKLITRTEVQLLV
jgi:hypothetical protein